MNKKHIINLSIPVLLIILLTGVSVNAGAKQDLSKLQAAGIKFSTPGINPKISSEDAVEIAKKAFPGFYADSEKVNVEYQNVTDKGLNGFSAEELSKNSMLKKYGYMNNLPVYIVTFSGMQQYYSPVPYGYNGEAPVHTEYNVIVDAMTGEPLMAYSYK